jgi:uncharacterized protein YjbJ (UPF0337 family)
VSLLVRHLSLKIYVCKLENKFINKEALFMNNSVKGKIDKAVGSVKENIGKSIESEQLELDGKLQKLAGEAREKAEETKKKAARIGEDIKESIAEKANDLIDSVKKDKQ